MVAVMVDHLQSRCMSLVVVNMLFVALRAASVCIRFVCLCVCSLACVCCSFFEV